MTNTVYVFSSVLVSVVATAISLPRLWRHGKTPWERLVYDFGVRGVGLFGGIFFSVTFPYQYLIAEGDYSLSNWALDAFVTFWLGLPLWLWTAYWWGRAMAVFFNPKKTNETDEERD